MLADAHINWILILPLHFLLDLRVLRQPSSFVVLRPQNIIISNIDLESILVVERDGLIQQQIRLPELFPRIPVLQFLRVELHLCADCFWVVFHPFDFHPSDAQFSSFLGLELLLQVDVLAIVSPESNQVVFLFQMATVGLLNENGARPHQQKRSPRELASDYRLHLDDGPLVAIQKFNVFLVFVLEVDLHDLLTNFDQPELLPDVLHHLLELLAYLVALPYLLDYHCLLILDFSPPLLEYFNRSFSAVLLSEILGHGEEESDVGLNFGGLLLDLQEDLSLLLHPQIRNDLGD